MISLLKTIVRSVPLLFFLLMISGCGLLLPTPSHREVLEIDRELTNSQVTERLLMIFAAQGISMCSGTPSRKDYLPDCSINWWQGNPTRADQEKAIIEVGDFPVYAINSVGHSARFQRISEGTLEIIVKGVFFYGGPIPNDDVARRLATIIKDGL